MHNSHYESTAQVEVDLKYFFADSIVPQLFVDSELILKDLTLPARMLFNLSEEDLEKSIYSVKEKIGHPALVEKIKGVLHTERNLEKVIWTADKRKFLMNIQLCFSTGEEFVSGVIVTYLEIHPPKG